MLEDYKNNKKDDEMVHIYDPSEQTVILVRSKDADVFETMISAGHAPSHYRQFAAVIENSKSQRCAISRKYNKKPTRKASFLEVPTYFEVFSHNGRSGFRPEAGSGADFFDLQQDGIWNAIARACHLKPYNQVKLLGVMKAPIRVVFPLTISNLYQGDVDGYLLSELRFEGNLEAMDAMLDSFPEHLEDKGRISTHTMTVDELRRSFQGAVNAILQDLDVTQTPSKSLGQIGKVIADRLSANPIFANNGFSVTCTIPVFVETATESILREEDKIAQEQKLQSIEDTRHEIQIARARKLADAQKLVIEEGD